MFVLLAACFIMYAMPCYKIQKKSYKKILFSRKKMYAYMYTSIIDTEHVVFLSCF